MFEAFTKAPQNTPTAMARNVRIFRFSSGRSVNGWNGSLAKFSGLSSSSPFSRKSSNSISLSLKSEFSTRSSLKSGLWVMNSAQHRCRERAFGLLPVGIRHAENALQP